MITNTLTQLKNNTAKIFYRLGFSANVLTALGLFLALGSGYLVYKNQLMFAGALLLLSGFLDLMDGAVARMAGTQSQFGGILDSTLDRYGDGAVLAGILFLCVKQNQMLYAALTMVAMMGSFAISYVRARAECEVSECRVGFWERGERIVWIALGLLFGNIQTMLWILALGTQATVFQRLFFAKLQCQTTFKGQAQVSNFIRAQRGDLRYIVKILALCVVLAFLRP